MEFPANEPRQFRRNCLSPNQSGIAVVVVMTVDIVNILLINSKRTSSSSVTEKLTMGTKNETIKNENKQR